MTTNTEDEVMRHDTMMCGDPKFWFPMRVTYARERKVKDELDRLKIENFLPMKYKVVDADTSHPHKELVPAINNLIFVRHTQKVISMLKSSNEVLKPLRYMMDQTAGDGPVVMTVADKQIMSDSGMTMNRTIIVGRRTSNRGMAACHLWLMVKGYDYDTR